MRHASWTAAEQIARLAKSGETWDVLFCSDMLNLAELRGLSQIAAALPSVIYFHENQLTYPVRKSEARDQHFAVSNFVSAAGADEVWFNSSFHRDEFLSALPEFWQRMPDHPPVDSMASLAAKCHVQWPGVDELPKLPKSRQENRANEGDANRTRSITWAARWEHDKNPEAFFAALESPQLAQRDWRLNVLGQSFPRSPDCFEQAQNRWAVRIDAWGFQASRESYQSVLQSTDLFVSTAVHEFFGIAVIEAIRAGATPLLPSRLSYPELLDLDASPQLAECFYDDDDSLAAALNRLLDRPSLSELQSEARGKTDRFVWSRRAAEMDDRMEGIGE